jgi:hypothetical protein
MEGQTIEESVSRIMFVTSGDNKIVDELQIPANVSMLTTLHSNASQSFMTGNPNRSCKRRMEAVLGGGWRASSYQDGMRICILEGNKDVTDVWQKTP